MSFSTSLVHIRIDSNWGESYTCIYRVRVHGDPRIWKKIRRKIASVYKICVIKNVCMVVGLRIDIKRVRYFGFFSNLLSVAEMWRVSVKVWIVSKSVIVKQIRKALVVGTVKIFQNFSGWIEHNFIFFRYEPSVIIGFLNIFYTNLTSFEIFSDLIWKNSPRSLGKSDPRLRKIKTFKTKKSFKLPFSEL